MRTWLLSAFDSGDRLYRGNDGYADDPRQVYLYDSFVQNHRQVAGGDTVFLRDKRRVLGTAIIEHVSKREGFKERNHCPRCSGTQIKARKRAEPEFRCSRCGELFEKPTVRRHDCTLYEAHFGFTFVETRGNIPLRKLRETAPRYSGQLAMLELDTTKARKYLPAFREPHPETDERATTDEDFEEGNVRISRTIRYERNRRARALCIAHHGTRCAVCDLSLEERYGEVGKNVIEVHHLEPIAARGGSYRLDPVRDLRPFCPNCHTIAHKRSPPFGVKEIRGFLTGTSQKLPNRTAGRDSGSIGHSNRR